MNKKFQNLLFYNYRIKNFADKILESGLLRNPFPRILINRQIKKIVSLYKEKPYCLRIENTNFCNSRCFLCPHPSMKRKKGVMDRKLYAKIVDEAQGLGIDYINLHNFGEPLLDRDFVWRVRYAKEKGIRRVGTNTNGQLLNHLLAEKLINSGLDEIYISLDAATSDTYRKMRVGLDFKRVKNNVIWLSKIKKKLKVSHPRIIVDFLESDLNFGERKKFINDWKKVVDGVCISRIHDWAGKKTGLISEKSANYVSQSQIPCRLPFTELVVGWDGRAFLCCLDVEGEVVVGDAKKESLKGIWQGKYLEVIRRKQLALAIDKLKLCTKCQNRVFWWF